MRRNRPLLKEVGHFEAINIRLKVMFTANTAAESFIQRLFQKRMQSSKIFEEFEVRGQGLAN